MNPTLKGLLTEELEKLEAQLKRLEEERMQLLETYVNLDSIAIALRAHLEVLGEE